MLLNDRQIKAAKPETTPYELKDGNGLKLLVRKSGVKTWLYEFRFNGKEQTLTIGRYPHISLSEARQALERAKEMIANGINPTTAKQEEKAARWCFKTCANKNSKDIGFVSVW